MRKRYPVFRASRLAAPPYAKLKRRFDRLQVGFSLRSQLSSRRNQPHGDITMKRVILFALLAGALGVGTAFAQDTSSSTPPALQPLAANDPSGTDSSSSDSTGDDLGGSDSRNDSASGRHETETESHASGGTGDHSSGGSEHPSDGASHD
jgi:hypothetical protein